MTPFEKILDAVSRSEIAETMRNTVEDSPWHRESNTWVHTMMALEQYDKLFAPQRTAKQQLMTKIALLAHDFGKPDAEEEKERDDGTKYRRYAGHELISANSFIDFLMIARASGEPNNIFDVMHDAGITVPDIQAIRFMIEYHLPYDLKDKQKRAVLKANVLKYLGAENEIMFYDMLYSDSAGRISDNHEEKLIKVTEWIDAFKEVKPAEIAQPDPNKPTMYMLIGVSGAGKSTVTSRLVSPTTHHFSLDLLREEMVLQAAKDQGQFDWLVSEKVNNPRNYYQLAYEYANDATTEFNQLVDKTFNDMLKTKQDIVLDNMNAGRKRRARFVNGAKQAGYQVVAMELWVPLGIVLERQKTRPDKEVPAFAVKQAYYAQQVPLYGSEVVDILVHATF